MDDFKEYVKRYCNTYGVSEEEALTHSIVKEVAKYYGLSEVQNEKGYCSDFVNVSDDGRVWPAEGIR